MYFYGIPVSIDDAQSAPVEVEWSDGLREAVTVAHLRQNPFVTARPVQFWVHTATWDTWRREYAEVTELGTDGFGGLVDKGPAVHG